MDKSVVSVVIYRGVVFLFFSSFSPSSYCDHSKPCSCPVPTSRYQPFYHRCLDLCTIDLTAALAAECHPSSPPPSCSVCACASPHPTLTLSNHTVSVWPTRPLPLCPVTSCSSVPLGLRFGLPTGGNRLPHPPGVCRLLRGSRVSVRVPAGVCVYLCECAHVCEWREGRLGSLPADPVHQLSGPVSLPTLC